IVRAIDGSMMLLILFSSSTNDSKQVAREVERADRRDLPLLLVRTQNVEPAGVLAYFVSNRQWIDVFPLAPTRLRTEVPKAVQTAGQRFAEAPAARTVPNLSLPRQVARTSPPRPEPFKLPARSHTSIGEATRDYEAWLRRQIETVSGDFHV